jgi:hypothetical protein
MPVLPLTYNGDPTWSLPTYLPTDFAAENPHLDEIARGGDGIMGTDVKSG